MNKRLTHLILILLIAATAGWSYTNSLNHGIPVTWRTLWELQAMPQHFIDFDGRQGNISTLYGGQSALDFRRTYEPHSVIRFGGIFETYRRLNEQIQLYAAIDFRNTYHQDQFRSIEKDFYTPYIAFSDTTEGDFQFNGPLIDFVYSQDLTDRLTWGLKINYGVERGIKDVYTQAKTRELNSDVTVSVRFQPLSSWSVDGWFRRYHGRSTFEAVKEFQDALVWTWLGYTVFRPENPSSSVDTERNKDGYQMGAGLLFRRDESPLSAYISGSYGVEENDARKGTKSVASQRGAWQQKSREALGWVNYKRSGYALSLFGLFQQNDDWGKTAIYEAVFLENEETLLQGGVVLDLIYKQKSTLSLALRAGNKQYDYMDYLALEHHTQDEITWGSSMDLDLRPYPVTAYMAGLRVEKIPLNFTWGIPSMIRYSAYGGFEYQWGFNRVCPSLRYHLDSFENTNEKNSTWQLNISVIR